MENMKKVKKFIIEGEDGTVEEVKQKSIMIVFDDEKGGVRFINLCSSLANIAQGFLAYMKIIKELGSECPELMEGLTDYLMDDIMDEQMDELIS